MIPFESFARSLACAFFCLSIAASSANSARAETKRERVLDIFQSQREQIYNRFHRGIEIYFDLDEEVNAGAGYEEGDPSRPAVYINSGAMKAFSLDALTIVICHELGHHLGNLTFSEIGSDRPPPSSATSIEGEADYYAGRCALNFFRETGSSENEAIDRVVEAARETIQEIAEGRLPSAIPGDSYPFGIAPSYPDFVCRMVTIEYGARGYPRPKCWYNPSH